MAYALEDLIPLIPNLRRYARLLSGSTEVGDELVRLCLELMKADPARLQGDSLRVELYRAFHAIDAIIARAATPRDDATTFEQRLEQGLTGLTPVERQVLILAVSEGFTYQEIGIILGFEIEMVRDELSRAAYDMNKVTEDERKN